MVRGEIDRIEAGRDRIEMSLLELVDDLAIPDDAVLLRRVTWNQGGGIDKYNVGQTFELTVNCFRDQREDVAAAYGLGGPCMSVGYASILKELGFRTSRMVKDFDGFGLVSLEVGHLRNLATASGTPVPQGVMLCPTEAEPWHAVVFDINGPKRSNQACKAIIHKATWEIELVK